MPNPLNKYTRRQEDQIDVDRAFLQHLEGRLLQTQPAKRSRLLQKWRTWFVLTPLSAAAVLLLFFGYAGIHTENTPVANAGILKTLFTPDTDDVLRHIVFSRTTPDDTEKIILWSKGQSYQEDHVYSDGTVGSMIIDADARTQCSVTRPEQLGEASLPSCFALSEASLHAWLGPPTMDIAIGPVHYSDDRFFVEWYTQQPISALTVKRGLSLGMTTSITDPKIDLAGVENGDEFYNRRVGNHFAHRTAEHVSELDTDGMLFRLVPTIGGTKQKSQVLLYTHDDVTVTSVPYEEVRTYPVYETYRKLFRIPLFLVEHEALFANSATTQFEQWGDQTVTKLSYTVSDQDRNTLRNVLLDARVAHIEVWYDGYASQLLAYAAYDVDGQLIERIDVEQDSLESDQQFLSIDNWYRRVTQ